MKPQEQPTLKSAKKIVRDFIYRTGDTMMPFQKAWNCAMYLVNSHLEMAKESGVYLEYWTDVKKDLKKVTRDNFDKN